MFTTVLTLIALLAICSGYIVPHYHRVRRQRTTRLRSDKTDDKLAEQSKFFGGSTEKEEFLTEESLLIEDAAVVGEGVGGGGAMDVVNYLDLLLESSDASPSRRPLIASFLRTYNEGYVDAVPNTKKGGFNRRIYSRPRELPGDRTLPGLYDINFEWDGLFADEHSRRRRKQKEPKTSVAPPPLDFWRIIGNTGAIDRLGMTIHGVSAPSTTSIELDWSCTFICNALHRPRVTIQVRSTLTVSAESGLITRQTDAISGTRDFDQLLFGTVLGKFVSPKSLEWMNLFSTGLPACEDIGVFEEIEKVSVPGSGGGLSKALLKSFTLKRATRSQLRYKVRVLDDSPGPSDPLDPTFVGESWPDAGFVRGGIRVVGPKKDDYSVTAGWSVSVVGGEGGGRIIEFTTPVGGEVIPRSIDKFGEVWLRLPEGEGGEGPRPTLKSASYEFITKGQVVVSAPLTAKIEGGGVVDEIDILDRNDEGGPTDDRVRGVREALFNSVVAWGGRERIGFFDGEKQSRPRFGFEWGFTQGGRRLCWGGDDDFSVGSSSGGEGNVGSVMAVYESGPLGIKSGPCDGKVTLALELE